MTMLRVILTFNGFAVMVGSLGAYFLGFLPNEAVIWTVGLGAFVTCSAGKDL